MVTTKKWGQLPACNLFAFPRYSPVMATIVAEMITTKTPGTPRSAILLLGVLVPWWFLLGGCVEKPSVPAAELLLVNGRVYTLAWPEPGTDGTPAVPQGLSRCTKRGRAVS